MCLFSATTDRRLCCRLAEAIQAETIPIYIWDHVQMLPYQVLVVTLCSPCYDMRQHQPACFIALR